MRTRRTVVSAVVVGIVAVVAVGLALAQDAPRAPRAGAAGTQGGGAAGGRQGGGPGGGRFDPAQMREQYMARIKESLQMGDEDWKALQPRIEKVMTLSREAGGFGGMRMGGGPGGRPDSNRTETTTPPSELTKAMQDLQKTLENKDAAAADIKAKLTALREAREKAKQELAKARDAVRELVTQRQEAQLVLMGILD